jgi:hypothetical protein
LGILIVIWGNYNPNFTFGKFIVFSIHIKVNMKISINTGFGVSVAPYLVGTGALSPWLKWLKREANHSPASSAEVNYICILQ